MKLNLGQDSEARFGQDFEAYVFWRGWCLLELVIWTQPSGPLRFGNVYIPLSMSRTEQLETEQIQYQCNSRNDHLNHLHCKGESNTPYLYFQDNNFQNTGVNMITQFLDKILQFLHCVDMSISFVKTPHVPTQQAWHFINPRTKYLCNWWRKPCVIYGFNKCYDAFPIMSLPTSVEHVSKLKWRSNETLVDVLVATRTNKIFCCWKM